MRTSRGTSCCGYGAYTSTDSVGHILLRGWMEHAEGGSIRNVPPATEGHYELLADYAEGHTPGMTVGHAPWNHDTIARQALAKRLIADFRAEVRMRFKSYVGRTIDDEALEVFKAEFLKIMWEMLPDNVITVEQDPEHPDLLHIRAYHPTSDSEGQG